MNSKINNLLSFAEKGLTKDNYLELCDKIISTIEDYKILYGKNNLTLMQAKILNNNPNVQKAINKGWKMLKPLKGHDLIVLAAPKGWRVRGYSLQGGWNYVWGDIDANGTFCWNGVGKYGRYSARAYYEQQAKQLNGFKGEGCSYLGK